MAKQISVVIPTFRRPQLLKRCIGALALQKFSKDDFEIIVVSDGPDNGTRTMLNELHVLLPFVQYISLTHNQGPAAARNAGWKSANGKLIAFTDDDCLPSPLWLFNLWKEYSAISFPEHVAFTGRVVVPIPENPTDYERNTSHLETADFVTANCACTKAALELINGFDERFRYAWREDSDLEFRLLEHNIGIYRKIDAVVVHPVRKAQWGVSIKEQRKTMFNALLFKKFPSLYRKKIQSSPAWNYYLIVGGFLTIITGLAFQNKLLASGGFIIYAGFTIGFIMRRLAQTSRSSKHITEMIATSLVIPFLSVYWTIYGSLKYRVLYY
jgi:glycosyltransferase involved in cell wall biosynthesis